MSAVLCIQNLFLSSFKIQLADAHAEAIWKLARADLNKNGHRKLVKAIKEAESGCLDTFERDALKDSIGIVTAGEYWPCNATTEARQHRFFERFYGYLRRMGAITEDQDPCLKRIITLVEVDDSKGMTVRVQKRVSGLYDIHTKQAGHPESAYTAKHPDCSADDVIRALGHYLQF